MVKTLSASFGALLLLFVGVAEWPVHNEYGYWAYKDLRCDLEYPPSPSDCQHFVDTATGAFIWLAAGLFLAVVAFVMWREVRAPRQWTRVRRIDQQHEHS